MRLIELTFTVILGQDKDLIKLIKNLIFVLPLKNHVHHMIDELIIKNTVI